MYFLLEGTTAAEVGKASEFLAGTTAAEMRTPNICFW